MKMLRKEASHLACLLQLHLVDRDDLMRAQAELADIPRVEEIDIDQVNVEFSDTLPVSFARNHGVPLWDEGRHIKIV